MYLQNIDQISRAIHGILCGNIEKLELSIMFFTHGSLRSP